MRRSTSHSSNAEFGASACPTLSASRMIDTLALAKARFPGMPNSLDALCRRFAIDLSARTTHNALLDCRLLADVYVELTGGRQRGLSLAAEKATDRAGGLHAHGRPHAAADRAKRGRAGRARGIRRAAEGSGLAAGLRRIRQSPATCGVCPEPAHDVPATARRSRSAAAAPAGSRRRGSRRTGCCGRTGTGCEGIPPAAPARPHCPAGR